MLTPNEISDVIIFTRALEGLRQVDGPHRRESFLGEFNRHRWSPSAKAVADHVLQWFLASDAKRPAANPQLEAIFTLALGPAPAPQVITKLTDSIIYKHVYEQHDDMPPIDVHQLLRINLFP